MLLDQETLDKLISFRHELHRTPEISGEESETSDRVASFLEQYDPDDVIRNLGGYGLAAIYNGKETGPTILIRCELDGLPITETGTIPYQSTVQGKGHLCGHDGHMAMVAGLATLLHRTRPAKGRVVLLFQPAEETGAGAKAVINDPEFTELTPDYSFSLHNLPGQKLHNVGIKRGPFNCASQGLWVTLEGKTSHASHPEDGISPATAMCDLIQAFSELPNSSEFANDFALVTVVHAHLGEEAFGITPGFAKVMITLRSETDNVMSLLQERSEALINNVTNKYGLKAVYGYEDIFAASVNAPEATEILRTAFRDENITLDEMPSPMRWSEDFGQFGRVSNSAMFTLGSGLNQPQLHNPDFDLPDELIETGTKIFHRVIRNILGPSN
ncbi:peptidase M20 [Kiloniella spongiae]|uniref:Peptidase M20 n=1 Tax=Kiloniella spongiae TaxID=1489064 RepID=A0A0H2MTY4_9PROT|nr:amidohydrolase [Kiloniella spongiae]KLN60155.1 peptidase M20 [Kiloniella spongiae]